MINLEILGNVLLAMAIYNIIIKATAATLLKAVMSTKPAKDEASRLRDKIKDKLNKE